MRGLRYRNAILLTTALAAAALAPAGCGKKKTAPPAPYLARQMEGMGVVEVAYSGPRREDLVEDLLRTSDQFTQSPQFVLRPWPAEKGSRLLLHFDATSENVSRFTLLHQELLRRGYVPASTQIRAYSLRPEPDTARRRAEIVAEVRNQIDRRLRESIADLHPDGKAAENQLAYWIGRRTPGYIRVEFSPITAEMAWSRFHHPGMRRHVLPTLGLAVTVLVQPDATKWGADAEAIISEALRPLLEADPRAYRQAG